MYIVHVHLKVCNSTMYYNLVHRQMNCWIVCRLNLILTLIMIITALFQKYPLLNKFNWICDFSSFPMRCSMMMNWKLVRTGWKENHCVTGADFLARASRSFLRGSRDVTCVKRKVHHFSTQRKQLWSHNTSRTWRMPEESTCFLPRLGSSRLIENRYS